MNEQPQPQPPTDWRATAQHLEAECARLAQRCHELEAQIVRTRRRAQMTTQRHRQEADHYRQRAWAAEGKANSLHWLEKHYALSQKEAAAADHLPCAGCGLATCCECEGCKGPLCGVCGARGGGRCVPCAEVDTQIAALEAALTG
jgi:hypothetical protein